MKFSEVEVRKIIKEEIKKILEGKIESVERKAADVSHILLTRARQELEDYLGELADNEEPSDQLQELYDAISKAWMLSDRILTGGETRDALPGIFENKIEEQRKSTKELSAEARAMSLEIRNIINELVPTVDEIAQREQFASADIDPKRPITVRPGTTEIPRLEEDDE